MHEWKVRSMDERDSRAAVAAAERAKVTTAVWLGRVIRAAIEREHEAFDGEVLGPGAVDPGPVANPQVTLGDLVTIAALKGAPRWLRTGAMRHIASTIHVNVPASRPGKALKALGASPGGKGGEGEGGV